MSNDANHYIIERLQEMSAYEIILQLIILATVVGFVVAAGIKIYKLLEKYRKAINEFEKKNKLIEEHNDTIDELQQVDNQFQNEFETIYQKIDRISAQLIEMQERDDARERANIKSRISDLYRRFNETQSWSEMEKEAMEELIASYEECGGENSFIHEVVQKEMYTWTVEQRVNYHGC